MQLSLLVSRNFAEEDARFAKSNDTFAFVLSQLEEASCDWTAFGNRREGTNPKKPQ